MIATLLFLPRRHGRIIRNYVFSLRVQVIITALLSESAFTTATDAIHVLVTALGELEGAKTALLLHVLGKHFVPADVRVADRSARKPHRLFKVCSRDECDSVLVVIALVHAHILAGILLGLALLFALDLFFNVLTDSELSSALANLTDIGTRETVRVFGNDVEVDIGSNGRLAELCLENVETRALVGQRNVDQLVETAWTQQSGVDLVWTVGGTNDEDVLKES